MGWTVLYIAFGIVALWLLGEVLLQYKARLRWRLLAFAGFLGVVLGVLIPSVLVIVVGAIAFATGQTYVTLSFRRGFSTGWAIGGKPGASRRRRRGSQGLADSRPTLEVSDLEYQGQDQDQAPEAAAETAAFAVYEPQPLPDDTGQYGVYTDAGPSAGDAPAAPGQERYDAYDPYGGQGQDVFGGRSDYPAQETYQGQGTYTGPYDYTTGQPTGQPTGQQEYAAYTDPYAGNGGAGSAGDHAPYDGYGAGTHGDENGYGGGYDRQPDPYAGQYTTDTPPGGVWVPQQRENEYPPLPPEAPAAPYGNGYDTGQNDQYRY